MLSRKNVMWLWGCTPSSTRMNSLWRKILLQLVPNGANGSYGRVVIASTTAPVDPADVAVVAFQIDVSLPLFFLLYKSELFFLPGWRQQSRAENTHRRNDSPEHHSHVATDSTIFYSTSDTTATFDITPSATANVNRSTLMMLDDGALEDYYY